MSIKDIANSENCLVSFSFFFSDCFARSEGRQLLLVYVRGLLSDVQRKNVEAMALKQNVPPRTLQRFLSNIVWNHSRLRDRCQQLIASEHAHRQAIGTIDETGTTKSGNHTCGVKRQYNGNRGKIDNCVNNVAIAYTAPGFSCLVDAQLYLPRDWAENPELRKKLLFQTK